MTWVDDGPTAAGSGRVRTIDALLPLLLADHLPADQARQARALLTNPAAYGAPFGPTGVHRAEPTFAPSTYWRGSSWPQLTYLLALAMSRSDDSEGAASLARVAARRSALVGLGRALGPGLGRRTRRGTAVVDHVGCNRRGPAAGGDVGSSPGRTPRPAPPARQHGSCVDQPGQHDEVAERQHLSRHSQRQHVAQDRYRVGSPLEVPAGAELDRRNLVR